MWEYERISYSEMYAHKSERATVPVAVLDLREEVVEEMVEAVRVAIGMALNAEALHWREKPYSEVARAALQAILPLRRGRGGK